MKLHALAYRIVPFAALFLALQSLMRLAFLYLEQAHIEHWVDVIEVLSVGVLFDGAVLCFFMIPVTLLYTALPKKYFGTAVERVYSSILVFILSSVWMFGLVSEWFFWEEFQNRFNFIAVDYLVYTHEVIGNIRESYPLPLLFSGLGILSTLISAAFYAMNKPSILQQRSHGVGVLSPKSRWMAVATSIAFSVVSYHLIDSSYSKVTDNRYLNEIAKNGVYELFSAFKNNELPFDEFYLTASIEDTQKHLGKLLGVQSENKHPLVHTVQAGGASKPYNVVMITVESLSASYMKEFGNQEGVTPYLDAIASESLLFTNVYAIGTRTVFGLAGLTLSIPPLPGNSIVRRPDNGDLFTMGSVLKEKGYDLKFIYGGYGYFDNMNAFFAANHYGIVDRTDVDKDKISHANVWGIADEDLLTRVLEESDKSYQGGKPFFQMVMTTSNHRPFTYPEGRIDIPSHSGRNGAVKYTDYAIGQFIKQAQTKPWFENTLFIIVADHTAGSAGKIELDPNKYHIPLIMYAPKILTPKKVTTMASQIDVAPTVLGLMNMSYESQFYGHDIMNATHERAFISNYLQLGYMTPEGLVVLKPKKEIAFFTKERGEFVPSQEPNQSLLFEALSYYQTASRWKEHNKAQQKLSTQGA